MAEVPLANPNQDPIVRYSLTQPSGITPITSSDLAPTPTSNFTQPKDVPVYPVAAIPTPALSPTPSEDKAQKLSQEIQDLNDKNTGQSAYRVQQESAQDITGKRQTITDLTSRLTTLKNEAAAIPLQLQNDATGRGVTKGGLAPIESGALRTNAIQTLQTSALLEAANGNLTTALANVDRAVAQKFDPLKEEIASKMANLDLILKSPDYTRQDKERAQQQQTLLEDRKRQIEKDEQDHKDIQALAITAAKNGADSMTINRISKAASPQAALEVLTQSGFVTDPLERKKQQLDLEKTNAEIAKIYADAHKAGSETGTDPSNIIAYAQQYASTGMIPTGIPKGTFGAVAQIAKDMPKQDGAVISSVTGVKDSKVPAGEQDDISRLYNIAKMADELKTLDAERSSGVIAGSVGKVFGSEAQAKYLTQRKAIIDEIARMQTGAALTTQEQAFYEDYLPGRLSNAFFLGQSSGSKIDNFATVMHEKLQNALKNKSLSIVGYSKVNLGGHDYTVGAIVTNSAGQQGRVNADGTITPLSQ